MRQIWVAACLEREWRHILNSVTPDTQATIIDAHVKRGTFTNIKSAIFFNGGC
ncbi:MAG: hypothetical protein JW786_02360 [Desulfobacterales bacterium]|nr:hypothetical protein [Desulfobacterales bacterium]